VTPDEAERLAITLRSMFADEAANEAFRGRGPNVPFETLPLCPICGAPPAPGLVGGILCINDGGLIAPHLARVRAWRAARGEGWEYVTICPTSGRPCLTVGACAEHPTCLVSYQ
jgi:hypothetical protein